MIFSSSRLLLLQLTEFRFHGEMLSCSVFSLPKAPISPLKAKAQFLQSRFPSFFHFIQRWSTSKWSRNPDIVHYIFHLISFSGVWLPAKSQTISHCLHFAISHGKCSGKSHMSDTMIIISSLWFAYDANIYASKLMWIVNCLEDFFFQNEKTMGLSDSVSCRKKSDAMQLVHDFVPSNSYASIYAIFISIMNKQITVFRSKENGRFTYINRRRQRQL